MKKLRVAVTGGSGRIGSRVVRYLWELGHTVFNVDQRSPRDAIGTYCYADLRQRAQVQPIFEKVDAVCHLGEFPGVPACLAPEEFVTHNTGVGTVVLHTAADLKLRFIYTSTCQVYGMWGEPINPPKHLPFDETHPFQPSNIYACAKVTNEYLAQMISRNRGLSIAIFRFPAVWRHGEDAGQWGWLDGCPQIGDGCGTYLGIDDAARAYALALEHPRPGCEAYHFTAAEVAATVPLAKLVERHPGFPKLPADWPKMKSPVICDKAKEHFGWEPQFNVLEAFRKKYGRDPHSPK